MGRFTSRVLILLALGLGLPGRAAAQTITYHLHGETSNGTRLLKTTGPDAPATFVQNPNLRAYTIVPSTVTVTTFIAQTAVPGTIPANSTVTFTLWMKKTANFGTVYPAATLYFQDSNGITRTQLCSATGSTALTTTLTKFTLSCVISSSYSLTTSNPFLLYVEAAMTAGVGNHNVYPEIEIGRASCRERV